jgi:2'-5' RNA ligase
VARIADALRQRVEREQAGAFKWVSSANFHVTLHFLGHLSDAAEASVRAAIGDEVRMAPIDVALQLLGRFPSGGPPRVLWLGVTDGAESLAQLHAELGRRLGAAGVECEARPFSAHLTLARARPRRGAASGGRTQLRALLEAATPRDAVVWRADRVTLFESQLSPHGSTYTPRALVMLRP